MNALKQKELVDVSVDVSWKKNEITHKEHFFAKEMNLYRDIFPGSLLENVKPLKTGETISIALDPGRLVPDYRREKQFILKKTQVRPRNKKEILNKGRFYPQGWLSGIPGIFRENINPFRCIAVDDQKVVADLNHPLAGIPIQISFTADQKQAKHSEMGGTCTEWLDMILSGPGMQSRCNGSQTDFFSEDAFHREDNTPDSVFYTRDRFVHHIDDAARHHLKEIYKEKLKPGYRVLDLMAGWESHLPENPGLASVHGIGLNAGELSANTRLTSYSVQDLNLDPLLKFKADSFDAVICSLSVEYLTDPVKVFKEVGRVLKPGKPFAVSFSNRWFPTKSISVWKDIHEFERTGLVLEYFLKAGGYSNLETRSIRGYPRPESDKYAGTMLLSDPVYAVMGQKN